MKTETQKIIDRYEKRKGDKNVEKNSTKYTHYMRHMKIERESRYATIVQDRFDSLNGIKVLEVGAGTGDNIGIFKELGINHQHIFANELLSDRLAVLRQRHPDINVIDGDALKITEEEGGTFDIVLQATVFTSILDSEFKTKLANKMWSLLKPGGVIIWYDFAFDNPRNKDVKGVKQKEVKQLFDKSKNIVFHRTTLAPPIGRRVSKLYPMFNFFPFLRSHIIAEIYK
ncbi:class I SAM-dependent methyltransferase [Spongiimicrobium sp. 3-5]|uniref:class I SAM-dependent methyltransferase n=1 Tax=Spongiimicrobium sp. 3-5 TaxID=3332596 RepID=UPI00397FE1C0